MPQYWIFFWPGVGGDGLANLLEKCPEIEPIDHHPIHRWWRVQRIVDGYPKFSAPLIDSQHCFRYNFPFLKKNNHLNSMYESAVLSNKKIVVTSHDVDLESLKVSDRKDIFYNNQIKILLESRDYHRCLIDYLKKNLHEFPRAFLQLKSVKKIKGYTVIPNIDRSNFDHVVYIEDLRQDFGYFNSLLQKLGLSLDKQHYDRYLEIVQGKLESDLGDIVQVPRYQTYQDRGLIRYHSIDV